MDGRNVKSTLEFDNNVAKVRDPRTRAGRTNNNRKLWYQLGVRVSDGAVPGPSGAWTPGQSH